MKSLKQDASVAEQNAELEAETFKNCPILYCQASKTPRESCMVFGWECGNGWNRGLQELSYKLEALNMMFYNRYRARVQFDQIKEKWGVPAIYYSVVVDPGKISMWLASFCERQHAKLLSAKYKPVFVVDEPESKYDEVEELTKEEWTAKKSSGYLPSNVELVKRDGKHLRITHLTKWQRGHYEPTQHKLKWKLKGMWCKLSAWLKCNKGGWTQEQEVVVAYMDQMAREWIDETYKKLSRACEHCGAPIGVDERHPKCQTAGWIKYLCKDCADATHKPYYKDGAKWEDGKIIMTKAQVEREKREVERKLAKKYKKIYNAEKPT